MGNEKSRAAAKQSSGDSKDEVNRRRDNVKMTQNVHLIWLDSSSDTNRTKRRDTIIQLRRVMSTINSFTNTEECIRFLEDLHNEKACMIVSGPLSQHIVSRVHNMSQVDSIFMFYSDKSEHKQWSKIKGTFTEITFLCEAVKKVVQKCERNTMSISFMDTSGDISKQNFDQLEPTFMYTQILKEIFLTIEFDETHIKEFIRYCREILIDSELELENIKKIERQYRNKTPIWWYTCDCFLYRMLNRALRIMDVEVIIKMGFFIADLHRHIEQLHSKQFDTQNSKLILIVYRGQSMSKNHFEKLTKAKGGLLSFNNFLSTTRKYEVSLEFAKDALADLGTIGIVFVMTIDPSQSTTPFASINDVSYFKDKEDEVLFSMNTVFRIRDIKPIRNNHRLFQVDLTLTSENDTDLRKLTDRIREETFPNSTGWDRLGLLLLKLGHSDKAQEIYETLLEDSTKSAKAPIYGQPAWVKYNQGEYKEALTYYKKSLEIKEKTFSTNHPDLALTYNNIGLVYDSMGEYLKALASYEKALEIQHKSLPSNHRDLAASYNNLGMVYDKMGDYIKALSYYEKDLEINQKILPPNHPDIAEPYNNIGLVYKKMGEYTKALSSHNKALEIRERSLPPNHPDLAVSYNSIGTLYGQMREYIKALSNFEKALAIQQRTLPSHHLNLASSNNNNGMLYGQMGKHIKALPYLEKAFEIRQQSLPPKHLDLAISYNNIGLAHENLGDSSKARSFYEHAVEIGQHSLPPNHSDLPQYRENLNRIKNKL